MAALIDIEGIGKVHAENLRNHGLETQEDLLAAAATPAGRATVPELAQRNATNLAAALAEVNEAKILVRQLPTSVDVARWVEEAKTLPRVLFY